MEAPFAELMHSLKSCAAYWGLALGMSLRYYQALYSPLTIICFTCFTWAPVITARSSLRSIKKDYRALGAAVSDSRVQIVFFINPDSKREGV